MRGTCAQPSVHLALVHAPLLRRRLVPSRGLASLVELAPLALRVRARGDVASECDAALVAVLLAAVILLVPLRVSGVPYALSRA